MCHCCWDLGALLRIVDLERCRGQRQIVGKPRQRAKWQWNFLLGCHKERLHQGYL